MDELPGRIRSLRRKLVFLWFALGPGLIALYVAICKQLEDSASRPQELQPALADSLLWILVAVCVVETADVLWFGRACLSEERLRQAALAAPSARMPDPLASRFVSTQVLMAVFADTIVVVGMILFFMGLPFDKLLNFVVYGLGLTIYIGGTIPARLNKFEEVALSVQEGVEQAGESREDA
jgi:hypothetical protein